MQACSYTGELPRVLEFVGPIGFNSCDCDFVSSLVNSRTLMFLAPRACKEFGIRARNRVLINFISTHTVHLVPRSLRTSSSLGPAAGLSHNIYRISGPPPSPPIPPPSLCHTHILLLLPPPFPFPSFFFAFSFLFLFFPLLSFSSSFFPSFLSFLFLFFSVSVSVSFSVSFSVLSLFLTFTVTLRLSVTLRYMVFGVCSFVKNSTRTSRPCP